MRVENFKFRELLSCRDSREPLTWRASVSIPPLETVITLDGVFDLWTESTKRTTVGAGERGDTSR